MCIIFIITPSKVQTTESGNKTAKRKIIIFFSFDVLRNYFFFFDTVFRSNASMIHLYVAIFFTIPQLKKRGGKKNFFFNIKSKNHRTVLIICFRGGQRGGPNLRNFFMVFFSLPASFMKNSIILFSFFV